VGTGVALGVTVGVATGVTAASENEATPRACVSPPALVKPPPAKSDRGLVAGARRSKIASACSSPIHGPLPAPFEPTARHALAWYMATLSAVRSPAASWKLPVAKSVEPKLVSA
jgi:hypothetical protein